jgi:hypothetical protein
MDQGIKSVSYVNNEPKFGALVTVENLEKLPMPVIVEATTVSGKKIRKNYPWKSGKETTYGNLKFRPQSHCNLYS